MPVEERIPPRDIFYYRRVGTSPQECWYTNAITAAAGGTTATADSRLYAIPFIVPKKITLDRIAINVTTACTNAVSGRLGIYADDGNLYPGTLLIDAGTVTLNSTGVKTLTINQVLTPGLYWLVLGTPAMGTTKASLRALVVACFFPILGLSSSLDTTWNTYYYISWTYGSLPTTFPSGATLAPGTTPAIFVRLSA